MKTYKFWKAGFILVLALFIASSGLTAHSDLAIRLYDELVTIKGRPAYVPDQLIIQFARTTGPALRSQTLAAHGLTLVETLPSTDFALVAFDPSQTMPAMVDQLAQDPAIASAEPNYYRYALFDPDDTYYSYQWHFPLIQTNRAWDLSTGQSVTVAVIDTGVAYEDYAGFKQAPDLAGTTFVAGYDFINDDTHPNDDHSHGTHVAGTIAQTTNNGLGVAGIAFNARIMPLKALDSNGTGSAWHLAQAIRWATDHGAQVINMSLGSSDGSSVELNAVNYAHDHGVTLVASAGNDGTNGILYPAAYDDVIAVGAVRYDERRAPYSNYGTALDVVAPGGHTSVDQNGDGYGDGVLQQTFNPSTKDPTDFHYYFFQGTSMAAPHVSGVAALIIARHLSASTLTTTPDDVKAILATTAKDLGAPGWDPRYGYGLIQAAAALEQGGTPPTSTPTAAGPTPTPTPVTSTATFTPSPTLATDYEAQVVQLINQERAARGKAPLTIDARLVTAGRRHSQDMADNNFFSHYGSDGSSPFDRIEEAGYSFTRASETIAGGYNSPSSVVGAWMNSSGHRAILLGNYVHVGVGYVYKANSTYRHYWTADFASPSGSDPTATPSPMPTDTPSPTPAMTPSLTPTLTPTTSPTATVAPPTPSLQDCADLSGDDTVDVADLQIAAGAWHNGADLDADINLDGLVNIRDIMLVAAQWGLHCTRN